MLCSIRFYVPHDKNKLNGNGNMVETNAQVLNSVILKKSDVGKDVSNKIATLPELKFLTPRGKYTLDFYKKSLRLHGKTFDYMIKYKHIWRGFLLPSNDLDEVNIPSLNIIYKRETWYS